MYRLPRTIDTSIREDLSYHLVIVLLVVVIRTLQLSFFKGFILIRKDIDVRGSSFRVKDDLSILVRNQFLNDRRLIIIIWIGSLNRCICYWLPIHNIDNNIPCFLLWLQFAHDIEVTNIVESIFRCKILFRRFYLNKVNTQR